MICHQEMCRNWTGSGCACEVMGIKPDVVDDLTIGGDDYLAIVERQRAEALATIERVKALLPGRGHSTADRGPYRAVDSDLLRAALKGDPS